MKCYVCDKPAQAFVTTYEAKGVACELCGSYVVSIALLAERGINKLSFDIIKTRDWLSEQRRQGVMTPLLATTNVFWSECSWLAVQVGGVKPAAYPLKPN